MLYLGNLNQRLMGDVLGRWSNISGTKNNQKMALQQAQMLLQSAVTNSSVLNSLNNRLMGLLENQWKAKASARAQPNKEDVNILFNTLELSSKIAKPTVRVEVKVTTSILSI